MNYKRTLFMLIGGITLIIPFLLPSCNNMDAESLSDTDAEAQAIEQINLDSQDIVMSILAESPNDETRGIFSWLGKLWSTVKADARTIHIRFGWIFVSIEVNPFDFTTSSKCAFLGTSDGSLPQYYRLDETKRSTLDSLARVYQISGSNYTAAQAHNTLILEAMKFFPQRETSYEDEIKNLMTIAARKGINTDNIDVAQTAKVVDAYMSTIHLKEIAGDHSANLLAAQFPAQAAEIKLIDDYFNNAQHLTTPKQIHTFTQQWMTRVQNSTDISKQSQRNVIKIGQLADASFDMWYYIYRAYYE